VPHCGTVSQSELVGMCSEVFGGSGPLCGFGCHKMFMPVMNRIFVKFAPVPFNCFSNGPRMACKKECCQVYARCSKGKLIPDRSPIFRIQIFIKKIRYFGLGRYGT